MYKVKNNLCLKYICDLFKLNNFVYNLRVKEFTVPRFETVSFGEHSLKSPHFGANYNHALETHHRWAHSKEQSGT